MDLLLEKRLIIKAVEVYQRRQMSFALSGHRQSETALQGGSSCASLFACFVSNYTASVGKNPGAKGNVDFLIATNQSQYQKLLHGQRVDGYLMRDGYLGSIICLDQSLSECKSQKGKKWIIF